MKHLILSFFFTFSFIAAHSQITQTVRGRVIDSETHLPLVGVNIWVQDSNPTIAASTNDLGNFILPDVSIGRITLEIHMLGYQKQIINELQVTSGKEVVLTIKLIPSFEQLDEAVVEASDGSQGAQNEMATMSSRSFSVEETQRYAASALDPGRMALAFSGVSTGGDDLLNEISVRGNSPRGILWRLEGIEIPNPNHFGSLGSSGGGISMLSASTLSTSDFYTSAFPSEFGNALSGVFDLSMRPGNNRTREHSLMIGALGVEASTEGYFTKDKYASYLVNYRYSTFALISTIYNPIGDILPNYSDLSFKFNFPETAIGSLSIFGLGGFNYIEEEPEIDESLPEIEKNYYSYRQDQTIGISGIRNTIRLGDKGYIKNVASISVNRYSDESYLHDTLNTDIKKAFDLTDFTDDQVTFNSLINYKLTPRLTLRSGANYAIKNYNLKYDYRSIQFEDWTTAVDSKGNISQLDTYAQLKSRLTEKLTGNFGLHFTYLPFNKTKSIEPRAALSYSRKGKEWNVAIGIHSKPEHTSTYFLNSVIDGSVVSSESNKNLEIPKAIHANFGHKFKVKNSALVNIEAYYQHHYDIPVEKLESSIFSTAIVSEIWDIVGRAEFVSEGKARNYGIDISLQRGLKNDFYYMANLSLYKSEYTTYSGKWLNNRYNGNYIVSITGGKEWKLKSKNKSIGVNTKLLSSGGNRIIPIDLEESINTGEGVYLLDKAWSESAGAYFRLDLGISYKINKKNSTHTILLDVQNFTGNQNIYNQYFNEEQLRIESNYQLGVFPFFNYRIEFQGKRGPQ